MTRRGSDGLSPPDTAFVGVPNSSIASQGHPRAPPPGRLRQCLAHRGCLLLVILLISTALIFLHGASTSGNGNMIGVISPSDRPTVRTPRVTPAQPKTSSTQAAKSRIWKSTPTSAPLRDRPTRSAGKCTNDCQFDSFDRNPDPVKAREEYLKASLLSLPAPNTIIWVGDSTALRSFYNAVGLAKKIAPAAGDEPQGKVHVGPAESGVSCSESYRLVSKVSLAPRTMHCDVAAKPHLRIVFFKVLWLNTTAEELASFLPSVATVHGTQLHELSSRLSLILSIGMWDAVRPETKRHGFNASHEHSGHHVSFYHDYALSAVQGISNVLDRFGDRLRFLVRPPGPVNCQTKRFDRFRRRCEEHVSRHLLPLFNATMQSVFGMDHTISAPSSCTVSDGIHIDATEGSQCLWDEQVSVWRRLTTLWG